MSTAKKPTATAKKTAVKSSVVPKTKKVETTVPPDLTPNLSLSIDMDNIDAFLEDITVDTVVIDGEAETAYNEIEKAKARPLEPGQGMEEKIAENSTENNFIQMSKFATLNKEEEFDLMRRIEIGLYADFLLEEGRVKEKDVKDYQWLVEDGKRAKTIFTNANRKLISATIKKMNNTGPAKNADYSTMTIYGQQGLDLAIGHYNYKMGYRFSTMAVMQIMATIKAELQKNNKLVKTPQHIIEKIRKMHKVEMDFERDHGRTPNLQETADIMTDDKQKFNVEDIKLLRDSQAVEKSVYENIGEADGSVYIDTVEDENLEGIFESEVKNHENTRLKQVLDKIATKDEKARDAFSLYYGFDDENGRIEDKVMIGERLGIGAQQIDNLIHRAEAKVCHPAFGLLVDSMVTTQN